MNQCKKIKLKLLDHVMNIKISPPLVVQSIHVGTKFFFFCSLKIRYILSLINNICTLKTNHNYKNNYKNNYKK